MDDRNLDRLLSRHREAPLTPLSATFQLGVWREIRRRKAEMREHHHAWFGWFFEPLFKPSRAFSALAFAVVLGVGLGTVSIDARNPQTRFALDLQVFGNSPPALPSTLMGFTK